MKGKVIYVDFAARTKKANSREKSVKKGLVARLINSIRRTFKFAEEPRKLRNEIYTFKHMM